MHDLMVQTQGDQKRKVYLVNLTGAFQVVMPYSCGVLEAYARQYPEIEENYAFQNYLFLAPEGVEPLVNQVLDPTILGLSLLSWNKTRSLKLARLIKERYPSCFIIAGGPEVPDDSSQFLIKHPYIDVVVHKEGERSFSDLLIAQLRGDKSWHQVDSISFRLGDTVVNNPKLQPFLNPINSPSPHLLGLFEPCIKLLEKLEIPRVNIIETNRGCPFHCTFCDWGSYVNQKLRKICEHRVFAELKYAAKNYNEIHIADANFGIAPRDLEFAKFLQNEMQTEGVLHSIHMTYSKNVNSRVVKIAKLLENLKPSRAGFTFGVQSFDSNVLAKIKRYNLTNHKIEEVLGELKEADIPSNFEIILGLPGETRESFLRGIAQALKFKTTDLRVYRANLLPNSELSTAASREAFKIESEEIIIVEGELPDEDEKIETITATSTLSKQDLIFLKMYVEMLEVVHFGKWLYYVAEYMRRNFHLEYGDFYLALAEKLFHRKDTVWGKITTGWYIKHWNSDSFSKFLGPISPFGIDWNLNHFRRTTFYWLCIAQERKLFFEQMKTCLNDIFSIDSNILADLLHFQSEMIMEFEYDPQAGKKIETQFNWYDYFFNEGQLKNEGQVITVNDKVIGRFKFPLKKCDPQSYFYVAGGYQFHFQKIDSFEFKKLKLTYAQNSNESRFEYQTVESNEVKIETT